MNELAVERAFPSNGWRRRLFGTQDSRQDSAFYGYALTILAIGVGWLLRDYELMRPDDGVGYWLGIVGGSLMLVLLLYPLRKRIRALKFLGGTPQWFSVHMVLGILGPVLILYHSNFQLGSFNSRVALYCMLLVAGSGVIGRHIYAHIHRGLYGRKTTFTELRTDLTKALEGSQGLASLLPELTKRLSVVAAEIQGDTLTGSMNTLASIRWTWKQYFVRISLQYTVHHELNRQAETSSAIARDLPRLKRNSFAYIRKFMRLTGRVAQFTLYERLFSLWHVLHMPFFFMMVISALVHVLAVHMY